MTKTITCPLCKTGSLLKTGEKKSTITVKLKMNDNEQSQAASTPEKKKKKIEYECLNCHLKFDMMNLKSALNKK